MRKKQYKLKKVYAKYKSIFCHETSEYSYMFDLTFLHWYVRHKVAKAILRDNVCCEFMKDNRIAFKDKETMIMVKLKYV